VESGDEQDAEAGRWPSREQQSERGEQAVNEFRRDPTTGKCVIIAPGRLRRPHDGVHASEPVATAPAFGASCPFCPGNENELPGIVAELPSAVRPGWRTRVVPNRFPIVSHDFAPGGNVPVFYEAVTGQGRHEVVIESPRHDDDLTTMSEAEVRDVLTTCLHRYSALLADEAVRSVIIFRNRGAAAGASLRHPHSQLVALAAEPPSVQALQGAMCDYYQKEGRCIICDLIAFERTDGSRVVTENDAFVTIVPFAALAPCEIWLLPKRHQPCFGDLQEHGLELLANAVRDALARLATVLNDPPYNYVIDSVVDDGPGAGYRHWRLRIVPQVAIPGGFELGSGLPINPSLPEHDAALLRARRRLWKRIDT
jgi:UDPglucose--hexose-1-phosphate uridylyltransferase